MAAAVSTAATFASAATAPAAAVYAASLLPFLTASAVPTTATAVAVDSFVAVFADDVAAIVVALLVLLTSSFPLFSFYSSLFQS